MNLKEKEMKWYVPFGPIIVEAVISDELHNILITRGDQIRDGTHPNPAITKDANDYRDRLVDHIGVEKKSCLFISVADELICLI